ncbi:MULTISPECIES: hypothetical protein [Frigoribacterium]|uniref:hypothetical protein n=1 Tax=Frigoribacterium TaxID=96492 RepID=UPI0006F9A011|nr:MULTISPECIES: hypothetical protein [Frigoribacterium]KQR47103.1 hypothetical protein ASF82_07120 [Frigoribacterium sp. Leaf164]MBD8727785.1 hypothetical protein [Frigoribacterium sp. CFBP 13707]NII50921.1 hypothetical protein [Frigoribacterium endophyticum]QNE42883.1 hypothetical protein F1C15_02740 [Frigoribacterium sp. NBH87]
MRRLLIAASVVFCLGAVGLVVAVAMVVSSLSAPRDEPTAAAVTSQPTCPDVPPVQIGTISVPAGPVAGYCQDRLVNAAWIMEAAKAQGIGTHTQAIGVMTAMGESSLRNIDHGDDVGPDSRGLFQQRDNGLWGTYEQRMDPYTAATMFFTKLVRIPGWKELSPTEAAHAVQVNADPDHYTRWFADAEVVVAELTARTTP